MPQARKSKSAPDAVATKVESSAAARFRRGFLPRREVAPHVIVFAVAVWLVIFWIAPAFAEEAPSSVALSATLPLRKLALHDVAVQTQAGLDFFAIGVSRQPAASNGGNFTGEILFNDGAQKETGSLLGRYLLRHLGEGDGFLLLRKQIRAGNRLNSWACVHASYGQLFAGESFVTRGRNGTALEEPSCLFVSTNFRF